jgi:Fe-S-cluster containining protein
MCFPFLRTIKESRVTPRDQDRPAAFPVDSSRVAGYDIRVGDPSLRFSSSSGKVELDFYSDDATLLDLVRGVEDARRRTDLKVSRCAGCGECCSQPIPVIGMDIPHLATGISAGLDDVLSRHLVWPEWRPDGFERRKAIRELARDLAMSDDQAACAYDFNNGEPAILPRAADGTCRFLEKGLCTIYEHRPLACRIYLCAMGDRLSVLQESIVHHGTWHLYALAGWIEMNDIASNPFVHAATWEGVPVSAFAPTDPGNPEDLFFYF